MNAKRLKDLIKKNPEPARGRFGINPMDPWSAKYGIAEDNTNEDLRKWFSQKWVRMDTKGNIKGDCARDPGEGKPKCLPQAKAHALGKEGRASAAQRKRREDPDPDRRGKPINVRTEEKEMNEDETNCVPEEVENIDEKNVPTSPEKWARAKSAAKSKFAVYPSAYANGWASKKYKAMGGGWKSVSENHIAIAMGNMMDDEGSMVLDQLDQLERACNMIRTHIGKDTTKQLPAWVQSKITLATDYIDTVGNYLSSKNEKVTEAVMKCKDTKLHETKSCGCYKEEMVNEVSKKKLYDYMLKAGSKDDPKKDTKDRGMNVLKATSKYETGHKVGDSVTVKSKFFGKQKGTVKKVDGQSVHVQRDGKKFSEKYPHDAVMKEEVLDELNYNTVKKLYKDRRADFHGAQVGKKKKGKEVSAKNVSTTISRLMGYKPTQNQPKKEEVEQIDELNYYTVDTYDKERKANPSSKKSSEVVTKNSTASVNRLMGKTRTQNSPMQGVKRELTPQQKTLQKDYHDSQRRGMSTEELVNELSNDKLGAYKIAAGKDATAADKAGNFKRADKRFSGIVKATNKEFDNGIKAIKAKETLHELSSAKIKKYVKTSTEIRNDSKSELKDIEKRPEIYKDNTDKAQQNLTTRANKLKTTINKRTTGLNRAFNKLYGVAEAVDKKEMTKSARMIKALYKRKNVKEETYDWEKEDKSVQTYGKKPTVQMTDKKDSYGEEKPKAAITMTGGTTLTGTKRDDVQIDPMMNKRAGPANTFPGNYGKNS